MRLGDLPAEDVARLAEKYAKARAILLDGER